VIVDTSVHIGHWPFRRHGYEDPAKLIAKLRSVGVTEAWAANFDGLLHKDIAGSNARLAEACSASGGFLVPFGTVNPTLPDWEDDLRRCREVHDMPGVRLYPNYHGYKPDEPVFAKLLALAGEAKLIVQLALRMEDERTQHPLISVLPVDPGPLAGIVARIRGLKLQVINSMVEPRTETLVPLARAGDVSFDFAMLEGVGCVTRLVDRVGADRVLFGSFFPLFLAEAAHLKVKESAPPTDVVKKLFAGNARALLPKP
jgi:predicted TIM-barrel fold metal-dependent hydrolase